MPDDTDPTDGDSPAGAVPVTVISGPLGAGKTTLVNRLLESPGGRRLAVVVNDMGEVNVDAERLGEAADDGVVDLSNGCICCRLGDDLVAQADRLAREREIDCIVVEASGISEPLPIARTLTGARAGGDVGFRLDTTVSVVDAYGFWKAFDPDEGLPAAAEPERPLADVMVDQVEFCDVLLLNKCDMVPDEQLARIEATVRELQPTATLHRTTYSEVEPEAVLATGRFDVEAARRSPGWKRALAGDDGHDHHHDHEGPAAAAHGVGSVLYERDRPFDPERLDAWLDDWDGSIVRAKGFIYVASRPEEVVGLSQAGPSVQAGPIGEWGEDEPATRLVFIGQDLDGDRLAAELDDCLADDGTPLTAETDPFPREG